MLVITTITPSPAPSLSSSMSCPGSSRSRSSFSHDFPLLWPMFVSSMMLLFGCVGFSGLVSVSAQSQNDCFLTVPNDPLTVAGLATPWMLSGAGCTQANPNTMTFVQGAVLNPGTGAIFMYDPLVVDANKAMFTPVVPNIVPANAVIAFWVQTHARSITLIDGNNGVGLMNGNCTSGLPTSKFGKFAFCGVWKFLVSAKQLIAGGQLIAAPLKTSTMDGMPCPSIRDFSFIGRDTQATVMASYLLNPTTGQTSHNNPINNQKCNGACVVIQSDSARTLNNVYQTLGCALWAVPDLTDPNNNPPTAIGQQATGLPLNEIQALVAAVNAPPNTVALVPANDPLATIGGQQSMPGVQAIPGTPNLQKLNLLRDGLLQPEVATLADADTVQYCTSMTQIPPPRLAADANLLRAFTRQGNANEAANLYTLVVKRQIQLYTDLGCPNLVGPVPFTVVPADFTAASNQNVALLDATPIQPVNMQALRCNNMFIFDTKCSFLIALLVVGGGIVLGFVGLLILRVLQAWKYGDKSKQSDSTRAAIRV